MSSFRRMDTNEGYRETTRANPALVSFGRGVDRTIQVDGKSCRMRELGKKRQGKGKGGRKGACGGLTGRQSGVTIPVRGWGAVHPR